jgi:hypothetical protein
MTKYIIITSIFEPTEAVIKFAQQPDYKLIVVGDKKTPKNWNASNVEFISIDQQDASTFALSKSMPYNHYCRKMFGYLYAMQNEANVIIDTDDDNIPKTNWGFPDFKGEYNYIHDNSGQINIYELFTDQKIWPRGFPLRLITERTIQNQQITPKVSSVGVWQGLADEDPDVDAIYRLTSNELCNFKDYPPVVLGANSICPFNSQNTAFRKELFSLLYLPTFVTFRFTDILRGLVAQPIMWLYGFQLGFIGATVVQKRNIHDFMKDFESEIPMYLHAEKVIEYVSSAISVNNTIEDNLYKAYLSLFRKEIVHSKEIDTLEAWLKDYQYCITRK